VGQGNSEYLADCLTETHKIKTSVKKAFALLNSVLVLFAEGCVSHLPLF